MGAAAVALVVGGAVVVGGAPVVAVVVGGGGGGVVVVVAGSAVIGGAVTTLAASARSSTGAMPAGEATVHDKAQTAARATNGFAHTRSIGHSSAHAHRRGKDAFVRYLNGPIDS